MITGEKNPYMDTDSLLEAAPQLLDFGGEVSFYRLLALYRRGSQLFADGAALTELTKLLGPQLEQGRVCNDFEWKTLTLLSAAAFQNGDALTRARAAYCAERSSALPATRWSRMCLSATLAQAMPAEMSSLAIYLDDLDQNGNTAAVLLSQAAYGHGNLTMLRKAVSRMTLYEESLSFPGYPKVQYYLGLAMQQTLELQEFEEHALLSLLRQLDSELERDAFMLGLQAVRRFYPLDRQLIGNAEEQQEQLSQAG
jgi:hypothetical protein